MAGSLKTQPGRPLPLGATRTPSGVNFALVGGPQIAGVTLCLFQPLAGRQLAAFPLDPKQNRTGNVWHIEVEGLPRYVQYGYKIVGPHDLARAQFYSANQLIVDPYAKAISSHSRWGKSRGHYAAKGVCDADDSFDWQEDRPLGLPFNELVIYEMHVRGFTNDPASGVEHPGTYLGLIEKIPYLQELGINAVELLPVFEFDECSYRKTAPISRTQLYNYWGYMPLNCFAPMTRYASQPGEKGQARRAIHEFKLMVRELHRAGIEVILDVVYNHTGENCAHGPSISYRGIAPEIYYLIDNKCHFMNFSGCGNTFNANHPVVRELILESLRYWVEEMHVDGFRFDLASALTRGLNGAPIANPPLIEAISKDPVLANTKLIAEAWDAGGLYQVGHFPYVGRWSEWNGKYRDHVRRFIKGTDGEVSIFATKLCGSDDLYKKSGSPSTSINLITAHDGFTLRDLVSYNEKHNLDNGEENRDGGNDSESWNCGIEGETPNRNVLALRRRQMRNFHLALMISQGVPMVVMGDEYGQSRQGNNNAWCHDSALNWLTWSEELQDRAFFRYYRGLIHFRRRHRLLQRKTFLNPELISWHGHQPNDPNWTDESRLIAFILYDRDVGEDLYVAFNAHHERAAVTLPSRSDRLCWCRIIDTAAPPPRDFIEERIARKVPAGVPYNMPPHSAILLKALPRRQ
jgi:isoamylase